MTATYLRGNIVDDSADVLVNTVNTDGVMGAGVALAFRCRWPSIIVPYRRACRESLFDAGRCVLFDLPDGRLWVGLATKDSWRRPSHYTWIETGLKTLADLATKAGAKSIAIPPPGCGNGGLDWDLVCPMVLRYLDTFDLRIYGTRI